MVPVLIAIILLQCHAGKWSAVLGVARLCLPHYVWICAALIATALLLQVWEWPGTPLLDALSIILANDLLTLVTNRHQPSSDKQLI